jgi:hypothetical protein
MLIVQSVPESESVQSTSEDPFRLRIAAPDFRHQRGTLSFGENVSHIYPHLSFGFDHHQVLNHCLR